MREVFKGWRRKVGCVVLVMSCALMGLWMRSLAVCDQLAFHVAGRQCLLSTSNGLLNWTAYNFHRARWSIDRFPLPKDEAAQRRAVRLDLDTPGREFAHYHSPILAFTIPLTLLSAYLILWKPRKRTEPDHA